MTPEIIKKAVVGGTFDILHKGHKALLKKAFQLGKVFIGLTSDKMAKERKGRGIQDFRERKRELENFIKAVSKTKAKIFKIENKFGFTLEEDFDYIVVSPETYQTALIINEERKKKNKKPLKIIKIDFVLAQDGKPISSRRILAGEIDREGNLK